MTRFLSSLAVLTAGAMSLTPVCAQVFAPPFRDLISQVDGFDAHRLPAHPRLLLRPAHVERMKAGIATPVGAAKWKQVTDWLETQVNKPDPINPDSLGKPHSAGFDIAKFRQIQNLGEDVENGAVVAASAYRLTGDQRYLTVAKRWTLAVASWNPAGASSVKSDDYLGRQSLSALALNYDGLYSEWTPAERAAIRRSILARAALMRQNLGKYDEFNNHPWFQCSSLVDAGLALADEDAKADSDWRFGADLFFTKFLTLWGRDGEWHEGINYVTFTLKYVSQLSNSLQSTGIDPYSIPALQKAGYFRLYLAPAGTRGIYLNDTRPLAMQTWDQPIAYRLADVAQDPVLQWYADWLGTTPNFFRPSAALYYLLYRDPKLPSKAPGSDLPLTRYWRDAGWVTTRTDLSTNQDVEFGFKSPGWVDTPNRAKGHDHPDVNNFLLNYLGQPLIADSGYYDYYSSPQHKNWTFTGKAHNTLLIDGHEQQVKHPGKVIGVTSVAGRYDWIEGQGAGGYDPGVATSWRRQILYLRPDVFVVRDVVDLPHPSKVTWLLHGFTPFELAGQSFTGRNGAAAVSGEIAAPAGLIIKQWNGFPADAQPERKKPSDYLEFPDQSHVEFTTPQKVAQVTFVTVFGPSSSADLQTVHATVQSHDGSDRVEVHFGNRPVMTVTFPPVPAGDAASPVPTVQSERRP